MSKRKQENIIPKIISKIVDSFSEEMRLAVLAGCKLEHEWDSKSNRYFIRTQYPVAVIKQGDGKIIVYEDHGGISPEIKTILDPK